MSTHKLQTIQVRLTADQLAWLTSEGERRGVAPSTYARLLIVQAQLDAWEKSKAVGTPTLDSPG